MEGYKNANIDKQLEEIMDSYDWYHKNNPNEITALTDSLDLDALELRLASEVEDRFEMACWPDSGCTADYAVTPINF